MACKIRWSSNALEERKEILLYWLERNKSAVFSRKLDFVFRETVELISEHPTMGRPTQIEGVRVKVIKSYLIIYQYFENEIVILSLWAGRRNPETGLF